MNAISAAWRYICAVDAVRFNMAAEADRVRPVVWRDQDVLRVYLIVGATATQDKGAAGRCEQR